MQIASDNTDNIPDMFLGSGTPAAPVLTDPAHSRVVLASRERPAAGHMGKPPGLKSMDSQ